MALVETLSLLHSGRTAHDLESRNLEFKEEAAGLKETGRVMAEAVVCLANASGGMVVLGVADHVPGPRAFVGTEIDPEVVRRLVHERTQPPLTVAARVETHYGTRLVVIDVPEGLLDVYATQGRAPRRIDKNCHLMTPAEQALLRDERQGFDWSAQPSERSSSEIPAIALEAIRERLASLPDGRRQLARGSVADILRGLGLTDTAGRLLRAGEVLMFGHANDQGQILYQYRTTPGGEPSAVERLSGPLILMFLRALELVEARRNMTPLTLPDGQQLQVYDFPDLAVREALANAVIHRDYRLSGPVAVDHSRSVLVVQSPGGLVSGVTPENILTHPSKPRNSALTNAFRVLGLAEETGRGVDRIYREMIRAGGGIPVIEDTGDGVRVALFSGPENARLVRYVSRLPQDERDDTDTMLVLFTLCAHQTATATSLAPLLQKNEDEIEAVLRRLASDPPRMLEATRGTFRRRHPAYRLRAEALQALGPAVKYQRRTVDDIDRKVISHVREYDKITNRTLRNIFDIEIQPAKDIIKALIDRGVLVKTSQRERGPNIEYGRGPKFPESRAARRSAAPREEVADATIPLFGRDAFRSNRSKER